MIFFSSFLGIGIGRVGVMGNEVRKGKGKKEKEFMANRRVPWIDVYLGLPYLPYFILSYLTCSKNKTDSSSSFNSKSQTNNHDRESEFVVIIGLS